MARGARFSRHSSLVLISLTLALAGCGRAPSGSAVSGRIPVRVAFWGTPEEIEIVTHSIEEWQQAHPGIEVVFDHTPFVGYVSKLLTRIAGKAAPDVMATEVNLFTAFWAKDVLLDLTPYVQADPAFDRAVFFPEVLGRFTVEGKIHALPRDTAPFACVYYNKKIFDEEGLPYPSDDWDLAQFLELAQRLTKREHNRVARYGFYGWAWQNFVYAFGGKLVDDVNRPTRCLFDQPEAVAGLQFYADLIHKHKVAPSPAELGNLGMGAQQLFATGRVAMFASGIWESPILRKIKDFEWDVVMFPKGPGGHRGFGTGGTGYAVLKSTPHPQEACEVVKALTGEQAQIRLAQSGLAQPANREVAMGEAFALNADAPANKGMLNLAVAFAVYDPFHPEWRQMQELHMNPELELVFNGRKSAEDAARAIAAKLNQLLATGDK